MWHPPSLILCPHAAGTTAPLVRAVRAAGASQHLPGLPMPSHFGRLPHRAHPHQVYLPKMPTPLGLLLFQDSTVAVDSLPGRKDTAHLVSTHDSSLYRGVLGD